MYIYRLHKYNPEFYNSKGWYEKDEWIFIDQIGGTFDGELFTWEMYEETERRYLSCIDHILNFANIKELSIFSPTGTPQVVNREDNKYRGINISEITSFHHNEMANRERIISFLQLSLRGLTGFALTNKSTFFLAVLDDYYVCIGCDFDLLKLSGAIENTGLFITKFGELGDKGIDTAYFDAIRKGDLALFMDAC